MPRPIVPAKAPRFFTNSFKKWTETQRLCVMATWLIRWSTYISPSHHSEFIKINSVLLDDARHYTWCWTELLMIEKLRTLFCCYGYHSRLMVAALYCFKFDVHAFNIKCLHRHPPIDTHGQTHTHIHRHTATHTATHTHTHTHTHTQTNAQTRAPRL